MTDSKDKARDINIKILILEALQQVSLNCFATCVND